MVKKIVARPGMINPMLHMGQTLRKIVAYSSPKVDQTERELQGKWLEMISVLVSCPPLAVFGNVLWERDELRKELAGLPVEIKE